MTTASWLAELLIDLEEAESGRLQLIEALQVVPDPNRDTLERLISPR